MQETKGAGTGHETKKIERALLVGVFKGGAEERVVADEHLNELSLLVDTFGVETAGTVACPVKKFDASILLGTGKLEELIQQAKDLNADMIIFDDEISPAQQRNLEEAFKKTVLDRTEVILGVFGQRAHTTEARLQVELAPVKYEAPRLKRLWTHLERQAGTGSAGGGGKFLKGMGEKQIEVDRRLLRKRIDKLTSDLETVRGHRNTQRQQRQRGEVPVFGLVGYTNAGKSTLLNALTDAGVFTEDKLFATLDTTTRKYTLPNNQDILLIDTVGFIRKLPHHLIAAFKSTLEEALYADILLHVVDASNPQALDQAETTLAILDELGAGDRPVITVLNKVDRVSGPEALNRFRVRIPRTVCISAVTKEGIEDLEDRMITELLKQRRTLRLRIPQSDYAVVSEVLREGNVLHQDYEDNDVLLHVDLPAVYEGRLEQYLVDSEESQLLDTTRPSESGGE